MDDAIRQLIERYRNGPALIDAALEGATEAELDAHEPGDWSARMVAHHLADGEANSYVRLRKLLAEDQPTIVAYDEGHWADVLHYDRPIATSLAVLRAVRASTSELLERLSDADLGRAGTHTDSGPYSVRTWLEIYAAHAEEHAAQISRARASVAAAAASRP